MSTLIFCTSFSDNLHHWQQRYRKWVDYFESSLLEFDQMLMVDDGSPVLPEWPDFEVLTELPAQRPSAKKVLFHFTNNLGRHSSLHHPGWFRSFGFAAQYAKAHQFTKVIHIESDAYLMSTRMFDFVNNCQTGWTAFWCPRWQFEETSIQVICKDQFDAFERITQQDYGSVYAGKVIEKMLPYTSVRKDFVGDRYIEGNGSIPMNVDYICQFPAELKIDTLVNQIKKQLSSSMPDQNSQPDIGKLLEQGLVLHQQDKLVQAKMKYEEVLKANPKHFDALHLLGTLAAQSGQFQLAVDLIGKAIEINPNQAAAYSNFGNALKELNQFEAALSSYDKAINIKPDYAEAYYNRGNALRALRRLDEALKSYDKAISIKPSYVDAYYNHGIVLKQLKRLDEALQSYDKAISIKPDYAEAYCNRGNALQALKRLDEALQSYDKAISIKPNYAEAYSNRGNTLQALRRLGEALQSYDKAISIKPDYADAYSNRGLVLQEFKRLNEALQSYDKAISIKPDYAEAYCNRSIVLKQLKRLDEALQSYDKAISIKPDYADGYWNKSLAMLLCGEFDEGWTLYEWRWKNISLGFKLPSFSQPLWLGTESLKGQTILLHSEQGLGDTIQFCRYAKQVKALGARVVVAAPAALLPLLKSLEGVDELVTEGQALPAFDYHCPLLSLPLAFKTELNTIPSPEPYLRSDSAKVAQWRIKIGPKTKPCIGLVWSGNSGHKNDQNRSLRLDELIPHLPEGFAYVCLQKEIREIDREALKLSSIQYLGDEIKDFADTAALCELMDVVISVDTSVAHLSGALGKPTWVLLEYVPDWRWLLDREDSPWYGSVKLYRQEADRSWTSVFEKVKSALLQDKSLEEKIKVDEKGRGKLTHQKNPKDLREVEIAKQFTQGLVLHQQDKLVQAKMKYEEVLKANPKHFDALHLLGTLAAQSGQFQLAVDLIGKAIEINPNQAAAYSNFGNALQALKRLDEALQSYDKAISIEPDYAEAYCNRSIVLKQLKRLDEALQSYDKAISIKPNYAKAYSNRGNTLQALRRLGEALQSYNKAISIKPDYNGYWNKSLALLLCGNFDEGWTLYEWRWKNTSLGFKLPSFSQPLWLGAESLKGQTILLHSEQGLGDTIQFCRYAKQVKALGARVVMEAPAALLPLLQSLEGVDELVAKGLAVPAFDYHCPLLSLPLAFKTEINTIPSPEPYLRSDSAKVAQWRTKLGPQTKPRIGLVWSGNPSFKNDHNRSLRLDELIPHLPEGFAYVCLQKEIREIDREALKLSSIQYLGDEIKDFADTAALCELMDVVISTCTSVAHLSGALGRPTWVLLEYVPDWRWLLDREDSPWYGSVKLYRQEADRSWTSVFEKVKSALLQDKSLEEKIKVDEKGRGKLTHQKNPKDLREVEIAKQFTQGLVLHQQDKLVQAKMKYEEVLKANPKHFDALHLLGTLAAQSGQFQLAVDLIGKAIEINPNQAAAYSNFGNALKELNQFEAALSSYDKAINIKPDYAEAYYNRGNALRALRRLDEALKSYDKAISIKPSYVDAYYNHGIVLKQLKRLDEALQSYDKAISIKPDDAYGSWNKSLTLLLCGEFDEGWRLYEWRWKNENLSAKLPSFSQPLWLGAESLKGQTILLHSEQGLGDTIQFCRYAKQVKALGARVVMEAPAALLPLLQSLEGVDELVAKGLAVPAFDYHCPLLSLPLAFKTEINTIPSPEPYLRSDSAKVAQWRTKLGPQTKPRIGLVWSGNPSFKNDHNRSLRLDELIPHLPEGFAYVCLQKEIREIDREALKLSSIQYLGDEIKDFADTAALCELMDVVISTCTSVAHLSGALGRPTWVLLQYVPDWRWLLDREDSPWYGSVKLYRQEADRSWTSVLKRLAAALLQEKSLASRIGVFQADATHSLETYAPNL